MNACLSPRAVACKAKRWQRRTSRKAGSCGSLRIGALRIQATTCSIQAAGKWMHRAVPRIDALVGRVLVFGLRAFQPMLVKIPRACIGSFSPRGGCCLHRPERAGLGAGRSRASRLTAFVGGLSLVEVCDTDTDAIHPACANFRASGDWPETGPSRIPPTAPNSGNIGLFESPTEPRCAQPPLDSPRYFDRRTPS
jgi:hypothetical protein